MVDKSSERPIRLLVLLEGTTVNGPAKNLLEFCRVSRDMVLCPKVDTSVALFVRGQKKLLTTGAGSSQFLDAANDTGVKVHCIHERFPFDPRVIWSLRKLVRRLAPDIIQTHFVKSHFLVRISGAWRFCPWVAFHHGYTRDARRTVFYNYLDRWSLRVPRRVVTVCKAFERHLSSHGVSASRITVLHNAISLDWLNGCEAPNGNITTDRRSTTGHSHERVVLAVGRLSAEKGFPDLIRAIGQLRQLRPDVFVRLVIVGDGPEKGRIEQLVCQLRLQDRVRMVGHVKDVRPYYRIADLLAVSSVSEGSPNVIIEAMAAGVPVVATAVGGIPEIVTDQESALLVEPHNPRAMASAINLLLSNPQLSEALICKARHTIKSRHSPQSRARALIELYETLAVSGRCFDKLGREVSNDTK